MQSSAPIRLLFAIGFAVCALLPPLPLAAQARPASSTTATPSTLPPTQPTAPPAATTPATPAQLPAHRADVTYKAGTLFVSASNSSLNQILREISRETGIKISGGVADERVFGQYGPDAPAQILSALLNGTGSNMLLVHGDGDTPAELVLTPRQGGPTPPNPNAHASEETPEYHNPSNVEATETPAAQPSPDQTQPAATPPVTPAASATDSSQPQSPNGVKTPQQIYDQLQSLRQQQQPAANPQ